MLALQFHRRMLRNFPSRVVASTWLMILLLTIPTAFVSTSVSRLLTSESEESCPLTEAEEACEEARVKGGDWELINRSAVVDRRLPPRKQSGCLRSAFPTVARCAEDAALNGCGAVLRC